MVVNWLIVAFSRCASRTNQYFPLLHNVIHGGHALELAAEVRELQEKVKRLEQAVNRHPKHSAEPLRPPEKR